MIGNMLTDKSQIYVREHRRGQVRRCLGSSICHRQPEEVSDSFRWDTHKGQVRVDRCERTGGRHMSIIVRHSCTSRVFCPTKWTKAGTGSFTYFGDNSVHPVGQDLAVALVGLVCFNGGSRKGV